MQLWPRDTLPLHPFYLHEFNLKIQLSVPSFLGLTHIAKVKVKNVSSLKQNQQQQKPHYSLWARH